MNRFDVLEVSGRIWFCTFNRGRTFADVFLPVGLCGVAIELFSYIGLYCLSENLVCLVGISAFEIFDNQWSLVWWGSLIVVSFVELVGIYFSVGSIQIGGVELILVCLFCLLD